MNKDSEIERSVETYFNSIQTMDALRWQALFAEDGVTYDPVGNPPTLARAKAEDFFRLLSTAFESQTIELGPILTVKNTAAAVQWTMDVVGKNGRQGKAEGISTFEFDDAGKITIVRAYWDDAALMAQIRG
ncbi:MAG: nuclear transport factor 2 family protein [Cyanobacteriota bacterium]|nr:nuclear transport factor 2 family protein [Cyanobacteriota bacterium]